MGNRLGVVLVLPEEQHVVRHPHPAARAVLLELLVQQAQRLGALHLDYWVFPDRAAGVVHPARLLVSTDQVTTKVMQANKSIL